MPSCLNILEILKVSNIQKYQIRLYIFDFSTKKAIFSIIHFLLTFLVLCLLLNYKS